MGPVSPDIISEVAQRAAEGWEALGPQKQVVTVAGALAVSAVLNTLLRYIPPTRGIILKAEQQFDEQNFAQEVASRRFHLLEAIGYTIQVGLEHQANRRSNAHRVTSYSTSED